MILIGIGETKAERIETLLALRDSHERYGHIQEIIVQNFRAKVGTLLANSDEPDLADLQWTIALARLVFGPDMSIQAPPNLSFNDASKLIMAGINDWGGVSPVTPDHVNPEAPWPHLDSLALQTAQQDKILVERLSIYPKYLRSTNIWLDKCFRGTVLAYADAEGLARTENWSPGRAEAADNPIPIMGTTKGFTRDLKLDVILDRASNGNPLEERDIIRLFQARDGEVQIVVAAANDL